MEDGFLKYFLDYGILGVMAWIFLWLYLKNAKKLDDYRDESKFEEERIRNRFHLLQNIHLEQMQLLL